MNGAPMDFQLAEETIARMFEGGDFEWAEDWSEQVWEQRMNGW